MRKYENFIIAAVLILLDGYWLRMTWNLPVTASTTLYGPRFFPTVIMVGIFICSLFFLWKGFKERNALVKDEDVIKCEAGNRKKVIILAVLVLFYIILFERIGFALSSIIYIIIAQLIFGIRNKIILFLISPTVIIGLNVLFVMVFKIPVP